MNEKLFKEIQSKVLTPVKMKSSAGLQWSQNLTMNFRDSKKIVVYLKDQNDITTDKFLVTFPRRRPTALK